MKKNSFPILLFMLFSFTMSSQSYIGYLTDNYNGVISNPANITDSRFKADINIYGISGFAGNDYAAVIFLMF